MARGVHRRAANGVANLRSDAYAATDHQPDTDSHRQPHGHASPSPSPIPTANPTADANQSAHGCTYRQPERRSDRDLPGWR